MKCECPLCVYGEGWSGPVGQVLTQCVCEIDQTKICKIDNISHKMC